jgi:hypothetical protein
MVAASAQVSIFNTFIPKYVKAGILVRNTIWANVRITIFYDFCQFSAKNGVFNKTQCYDQIFAKTAVL